MDINDLRITITLTSLLMFVGIMAWTWARKRRDGFQEAARLPFMDGEEAPTDGGAAS